MENLRFEESFKDAFDGAELAPSVAVWTNVELGLEKTTGGKMRGRLLFFQLLAAASMVFAMGIGSIYYLESKHEAAQPMAQQKSNSTSSNENRKTLENKSTIDNQNQTNKIKSENDLGSKLNSENIGRTSEIQSVVSVAAQERQKNYELVEGISLILGKRTLPKLVEVTAPSLKVSTNEPDPGMVLLAKMQDEEKKFQQKKPKIKDKLWASLGFGAGSYNPNANASNVKSSGLTGADISNHSTSDPASGTSYSMGVSLASKVSKRIVLQGGISYLNQNSTYTSSTASATGEAFLNEYAVANGDQNLAINGKITATSPYQVNNNLQYMSIPMQAGYIIIDRDFALQLNGGISTDIFFQSRLTPENSDLDEVTQGAGSDSPYRTLNFSGLLGTELSYKIGDHYRVAVNPGMRYALNSIYKSEVAAEVSPITFDVALRFQYAF